jgi:hypothetical protein
VQGCLSDEEIQKVDAIAGSSSTGKALRKLCSNYVITAEDVTAYKSLDPVEGGSICLPKEYNGLTCATLSLSLVLRCQTHYSQVAA